MEDHLVTVDKITEWLTEQVQVKNPISPEVWLDCAGKINVLLQGEQEKLFTLEQQVAHMKMLLIESGKSVAHSRVVVESSDIYKQARIQKAKIEGAIELIRISKHQSRMASEILRGN
jgi:hypothetical protein